MSGPEARKPSEEPRASGLSGTGTQQGPSSARESGSRSTSPEGRPQGLRDLAARLEALGARARAERWPGFTAEDGRALDAAASELETFEDALSQGMREAFAIGREHREREALLDRLNEEIAIATSRLATEAWGARRRAPDG